MTLASEIRHALKTPKNNMYQMIYYCIRRYKNHQGLLKGNWDIN